MHAEREVRQNRAITLLLPMSEKVFRQSVQPWTLPNSQEGGTMRFSELILEEEIMYYKVSLYKMDCPLITKCSCLSGD
jgi:hypothetical protein